MASMRVLCLSLTVGFSLAASLRTAAQLIVIEPDHYPVGTVLDHIVPQVALTSAGANNLPIPPVPFPITAAPVPPGYAATGTNVFAHAGVNFFNHERRLRMDFDGLVAAIYLDAVGSGYNLSPERGHLEVYGVDNALLAAFVTDTLARGQVQTMAIERMVPDIAWAVAWSEDGTFARLDYLRFSPPVPIPEPSMLSLSLTGLMALIGSTALLRRRLKRP